VIIAFPRVPAKGYDFERSFNYDCTFSKLKNLGNGALKEFYHQAAMFNHFSFCF
jgi:hypothetical protein